MYFYRMLIPTLAAISAGVAPLSAHVGDRLYPISYLSEETLSALDQDDASVEDWIDAVGEPTLTLLDFDLASYGPQVTSYDQYDPANLDFRIWLVEFFATCFDRLNHLSPEDSDVSQLTEGGIIGFDIWIVDYDDDSGLRALYFLDRPDGSERDPDDASALLDGVLLAPVGETGETAVQSVSWGRIKTSLGVDLRRGNSLPGKD